MTITTFDGLGLAQPLVRALADEGYDKPTPIQLRAIPALFAGGDLLGIAQTGTGKTAAFLLPTLQKLNEGGDARQPGRPRALVLAPTRELASQIAERAAAYGRHLPLRHATVYGGVGQGPQVAALRKGIDLLIATPGRLIDLIGQGEVRLDRVSVLIIDEADRMLDMGFIRDMRRIVGMVPKKRQTMLFSATLGPEIDSIAADFLVKPLRVDITPEQVTVDRIAQWVVHVDTARKRDLLASLVAGEEMSRVIVFSRTKHGANRITKGLIAAGIDALAIHGNKSQSARQAAIGSFRAGRTRVLVATDVASRGIDVAEVSHVINFDLPTEPESYVHRIGRTGRAGNGGVAISFCDRGELADLRAIERFTGREISAIEVDFTDRGVAVPRTAQRARPQRTAAAPRGPSQSSRRRRRTRKLAA